MFRSHGCLRSTLDIASTQPTAFAFASRYGRVHSTQATSQGTRGATGGHVIHDCPRCPAGTKHLDSRACDRTVTCSVCLSTTHCADHCWVRHGVHVCNVVLSAPVRDKFALWHTQYCTGAYSAMAGGPPHLRRVQDVNGVRQYGWDDRGATRVRNHEARHAPVPPGLGVSTATVHTSCADAARQRNARLAVPPGLKVADVLGDAEKVDVMSD